MARTLSWRRKWEGIDIAQEGSVLSGLTDSSKRVDEALEVLRETTNENRPRNNKKESDTFEPLGSPSKRSVVVAQVARLCRLADRDGDFSAASFSSLKDGKLLAQLACDVLGYDRVVSRRDPFRTLSSCLKQARLPMSLTLSAENFSEGSEDSLLRLLSVLSRVGEGRCDVDALTLPAYRNAHERGALWVPDAFSSVCMVCENSQFSMTNRRHHCRACGLLACGECANYKGLCDGYDDEQRLCRVCFLTAQRR